MQELEKILEEIEEAQNEYESQKAWCFVSGVERAANIIRKHMKNEENILKFYYCESEDDYYLGQRVQNMYYAKYGPGVFTWFMSRYLPWGTDGYPSEPKEIPFMEWIEGFIRKHMNDGWIPVEERLPEDDMPTPKLVTALVPDRKAGWDTSETFSVVVDTDVYDPGYTGKWECYKKNVIAWRPLPDPYRPERSKEE